MNKIPCLRGAGLAWLAVVAMSGPLRAADCPLLAAFNQAIQTKNIAEAKAVEAQIGADRVCGSLSVDVMRQRATLEVAMATAAGRAPDGQAERERLLIDADEPEVFWVAAAQLAEMRFSQRRFAEASRGFERAIEIIKNPTKTPKAPSEAQIKAILDRAMEARQLTADEDRGAAQYASATRDFRDGSIGGSFSEDVRGFKPKIVPMPVNFETGSDIPTVIGRKALDELLQAIKEQKPAEVIIVGHTDQRGDPSNNIRLSEGRARAVAKYLTTNGVTAKITVIGRGSREPLKIQDASGLKEPDDIWALNRRVEWRRP
jgi:outer membrane protein OmpA-like peptidoglycan-associated protein